MFNNGCKRVAQAIGILFIFSLVACADNTEQSTKPTESQVPQQIHLDVAKSPTCECCGRWVSYIGDNNFSATTHHPANLDVVKSKLGIAPQYQSCHTGVSKEGYVFEGHVPADIMQRFLAEKPKGALGLAVPGMPIGSPGMEMDDRFDDYDVLLLKKDGSASVYERIRPNG